LKKYIGWLWLALFVGLLAAANAQTPSPSTASTKFDGTYTFFSSTKVKETYTTPSGRMGRCADRIAGPLTIMNGQARYSASGLQISREVEGRVGSQGELAVMRSNEPRVGGGTPIEINLSGRIDGNGTVTARQRGSFCSYDLVWQKVSK
jgi:hypothetical protein